MEWGPEWKRYHAVSEMMAREDGKAAALCAQLFEFLVTLFAVCGSLFSLFEWRVV